MFWLNTTHSLGLLRASHSNLRLTNNNNTTPYKITRYIYTIQFTVCSGKLTRKTSQIESLVLHLNSSVSLFVGFSCVTSSPRAPVSYTVFTHLIFIFMMHRLSLVLGKVSWSSVHAMMLDEPAASVWAAVHTMGTPFWVDEGNSAHTIAKALSQAK